MRKKTPKQNRKLERAVSSLKTRKKGHVELTEEELEKISGGQGVSGGYIGETEKNIRRASD
jgi:bacteriocin-like protein